MSLTLHVFCSLQRTISLSIHTPGVADEPKLVYSPAYGTNSTYSHT
jgi:hypothetical protein